MAWTEADIEALESAIKTGAQRVRYRDREVEYRSIADMLALRDAMIRSLSTRKISHALASYSKGRDTSGSDTW